MRIIGNIVLNLSKDEINKLNKKYQKNLLENNNEYISFRFSILLSTITAYKSGKVVISGRDSDEVANKIKDDLGVIDFSAIGSDEVGTGDLFGPIVVCSAYVDKDSIPLLERLGVKDSKALGDEEICKIALELINIVPYTVLVLNNEKYNELQDKGFNMNKIKAILHNHAIKETSKKIGKKVAVVLDQFCEPRLYFSYLMDEKEVFKDITFKTKGESYHISCAAASIIARFKFIECMGKISKLVGFSISKGAGANADSDLLKLMNCKFDLKTITKMNFKNLIKVKKGE